MKSRKQETKYPSARLKGIEGFMAFLQEPAWKPSPINIDLLKRLDLAKGREGSAVHTLKFLGIINDDGVPTDEFDNLKNDYQGTLRRLIYASYAELFNLLPPKLVNQARLVKFFGEPVETAEYQAKLFVWLCKQAGIELPNVEEHFHRARFDKEKSE